jgi:hypothetical protein
LSHRHQENQQGLASPRQLQLFEQLSLRHQALGRSRSSLSLILGFWRSLQLYTHRGNGGGFAPALSSRGCNSWAGSRDASQTESTLFWATAAVIVVLFVSAHVGGHSPGRDLCRRSFLVLGRCSFLVLGRCTRLIKGGQRCTQLSNPPSSSPAHMGLDLRVAGPSRYTRDRSLRRVDLRASDWSD